MSALEIFLICFAIFALGVFAGGSSKKQDDHKSYAQRKPPVYARKR